MRQLDIHMNNSEIPKDAIYVSYTMYLHNVNQWFCPTCGMSGDEQSIDYISEDSRIFGPLIPKEELRMVQYCCGSCFEKGLYVTLNE